MGGVCAWPLRYPHCKCTAKYWGKDTKKTTTKASKLYIFPSALTLLWSQAHGSPIPEISHIMPGFPVLCAISVWESADHLKVHPIWFCSFCNHVPEKPTVTKPENSCFLYSVKLSSYLKRNNMCHVRDPMVPETGVWHTAFSSVTLISTFYFRHFFLLLHVRKWDTEMYF